MKRIFVLVLLSFSLINLAFAQQMSVIDPELYTLMNSKSGDKINVNIILKEQFDANQMNVRRSFSSREDRRAYMVNEMKAQTENLQADVLKTLKANERSVQVTDIKCHWLTNVITCNATPDAILKIAEHPDVEAIIYNKKQKLLLDGNDEKTVATRAASADVVTSVEYVNAPQVWNMGFTGKDVIVAVIDTGVNTEHEDLKDHLWNDGNGHHGKNTLDDINFPDYTDEYDITDVDGHGTHCAGTICGDGTSGLITGVAPDATLMCIKALDNEGYSSLESILAGVEYALENNANVLSMSLGFSYPMHYVSQTLRNVFEQALDLGVVAAVAAGNDGTKLDEYQVPRNINAPGNCPPPWIHPDQKSNEGEKTSVVCVGAIREEDDALCSFSSVGPVTWQNTTYNDYKLGSGYPTKIIRYDNDDYEANLQGVSGDYGVMFESSMLAEFANGGKLMSVFIGNGYSDNGYMYVYQGGDTSPGTEKHTQSYQLDATGGMKEIVLNEDVQIDIKQNLWVVFSSWTNPLIPVASNTDNANGRWVKKDGVWTNSAIDKMIKINVNISTSNVVEEEKIGLIRPDICAPGFQIKSTSADYPNSYYEIKNGTSMATPCVAGAMALLLEANPELEPADICRVLETTAVKLSETKNNETGSGRIDAYNAVFAVATNLQLTAPTLTATAKSSSRIDLSWTIAPGADSYTIYRDGDSIASGITTTSYSDTDLNPETTYSYEIKAIRGSESVISDAVSATTKAESTAYRIKVSTSTHEHYGKYLNISSNELPANSGNNTHVNVSAYEESNNQLFTLEDAGNGKYYLCGADGYYIKCGTDNLGKAWNVYAYSTTEKTPIKFDYVDGSNFYLRDSDKTGDNYFKVENGKIFCNAPSSNTDVVTWTLEPVGTSGDDDDDDDDEGGNDNIVGEEQVVSIGGDVNSNNTSGRLPISAYNCYTFSQQIYTQSEIGVNAGNISKIAFKQNSTNPYNPTRTLKVYMQNVQKTSFTNTSDWVSVTDSDKVFEGNVNLMGPGEDFVIELPKPFAYTGGDLLISVYDCTGSNTGSVSFYTYAASARSLFVRNDNNPYNPASMTASGTIDGKNNIIDITIETILSSDVPSSPENLVATAQGSTSIALSWDAVDGATSYNVYRDYELIASGIAAKSYTDNDLDPSTEYVYTVKAVNSIGESAASNEARATTESDNTGGGGDSDVCTIVIEMLDSYGDGWNGDCLAYSLNDSEPEALVFTSGFSQTHPLKVAKGTSLVINYVGSNMHAENSLTISYQDGAVLYQSSSPEAGEIVNVIVDCGGGGGAPALPDAPTNLVATAQSSTSIALSWDEVDGAESYNVYRASTQIATGLTGVSYTDEGLTPSTTYCYTVKAVKGGVESLASNKVCIETEADSDPETPSAPNAPQNLVATAQGTTSISLTWNAVDGATSYNVYRNSSVNAIATVTTGTSYTDTNLTPATEYVYTVKAVNANGESAASDEARATTQADNTPSAPDAPQNLVATAQSSTSIALTWSAVDGATSYNVYRNSSVNAIATVTTGTSYTDTNLTPATNYCYTVTAVNNQGESAKSTQDCATTEADNTGGDEPSEERVITIGTPVSAEIKDFPIPGYYNYGYSQQIYTQSEIGVNSGTITKIAFKRISNNDFYKDRGDVTVYMQNTTKASYTSASDWVNVTENTIVYQGSITFPGIGENLEITLKTPFTYTGENLLISICDKSEDWEGNVKFAVYKTSNYRSLYTYNDSYSYIPDEINGFEEGEMHGYNNYIEITIMTAGSSTPETPSAPDAPQNLAATAQGPTSIALSWYPVDGAESYNVYRNSSVNAIATVATGTSYTDTNLTPSTNYCYTVKAVKGGVESAASEQKCATTEADVPSVPTNLVATVQSSSSIALTWRAVAGAESYKVFRNSVEVKDGITGTSYVDTGLNPNTTYSYTVKAVNAIGDSEASSPASATTFAESVAIEGQYRIKVSSSSHSMYGKYLHINSYNLPSDNTTTLIVSDKEVSNAQIFTIESAGNGNYYLCGADGKYIKCGDALINSGRNWLVYAYSTTEKTPLRFEYADEDNFYIRDYDKVTGTNQNANSAESYFKVENGKIYCNSLKSASDVVTWVLEPVGSTNAPDAPTNLVATAESSSSISLTWDEVDVATSYNVYRDSRYVGNTTETYYTDNGLTPVTNYCYTVTALKDADESVFSEEDCEVTQSVSVDHNGMEKVVTIGGTQYESSNLPFNTWYTYSYSQQIYTKAEIDPAGIAVGGKITKIAFKQSNYLTETRNIVVYMQNTDKTLFTGTKNWAAVAAVDKVFEGEVALPGTGGSLEITLNSPIEYTGGNILISIYDKTNVFGGQANFYTYSTNANRALQTQGISCNPETMSGSSITGTQYDRNNSIDFTFVLPVNEYTGSGNWNDVSNWEEGLPNSNSNVSVSGDVTINGDVTVKTLVIKDGGSVTVESGKLTVIDDLTSTNASTFIINDGAQVVQGNDDVLATFLMNVEAPNSWEENHTQGWQFIASPMKDFLSSEFETEGIEYDLFKYDGAQDTQWVNYKRHADTDFETKFYQGRAYLASYETNSKVAFEGTLNHETNYTFSEFRAYDEGNHYANFYLLGNPFAFNMDWDNVTAEGLASGLAVVTLDGNYKYAVDTVINVGDGFFVMVTGAEPSLTYNSNVRSRRVKHNFINLVASGKAGSDNVIINFADNDEEGFAKLENFNKEIAEIYVKEDNRRYGIMNYEKDVEEIELYFDAKRMGEYTINAVTEGEFESVTLVDLITGNETDLLASSYTFKSMTNESTARFKLRIERDKENENFVYQTGSDLVIDAEGLVQIVDVMGRIIYSGEQNGVNRVNISNMEKAAYMVRNVNNKEVKVQKIVLF